MKFEKIFDKTSVDVLTCLDIQVPQVLPANHAVHSSSNGWNTCSIKVVGKWSEVI